MTKPRIKLIPETPKAGDIIEVKTLITHVMETGNRKDADGNTVPRNIVKLFFATFGGREVFRAEMQPGIAANPYIAFHFKVPGPGELELTWVEDGGTKTIEKVAITVS
ncbi:MAG: thiosulfate oxidation carrier complex protein SoxZ [Hyphomicrobiaceae bacterium]|nr:thiosulfate oxidation carrier complex protein SoxZ [Hyphomicrobiaceae bacterium]